MRGLFGEGIFANPEGQPDSTGGLTDESVEGQISDEGIMPEPSSEELSSDSDKSQAEPPPDDFGLLIW